MNTVTMNDEFVNSCWKVVDCKTLVDCQPDGLRTFGLSD